MASVPYIHSTDNLHWFLDELCARVVAQTGIPSDRYHPLILQALRKGPDFVLQKSLPNVTVANRYGASELAGRSFYSRSPPFGSLGQPIGGFSYRLVDVKTQNDITESNVQGDLWIKGPAIFKEYYKDPKATSEAFTDGWFKTGDIMYRDENYNFYYVDRLKQLIQYKNYQISPLEIERVISQHHSVKDLIVTAATNVQREELPCACVVLKGGCHATEQEIKDFVKDSLPDQKQLRGGVLFVKEMPMNPQHKFDRRKIKELVANYTKNNFENLLFEIK